MVNPSKTVATTGSDIEHSLKLNSDIACPAGFAAPPFIQLKYQQEKHGALLKTAKKVMEDPLLLRKVSDRVYELMLADLRYQRERNRNYGRGFNG